MHMCGPYSVHRAPRPLGPMQATPPSFPGDLCPPGYSSTPSAHPVFGKITEGYDLVERMSRVPTRNDNPNTPIKMISIRVA